MAQSTSCGEWCLRLLRLPDWERDRRGPGRPPPRIRVGMVRVRSFSSERRGRAAGRKQGGHAQVNEFGRQN